ncbi:hypothetical protein [Scytonema sp. PCC 10023]|uniref:hypothetical protein n=1 Tax=Scytonema sp. PCC 10023 TaxID=1680591 RepID=UPI0039C62677
MGFLSLRVHLPQSVTRLRQRWFSPQAFYSITEARSGAPHRTVSTINLGFRLPWCMKILPSSAFPARTPYLQFSRCVAQGRLGFLSG